MANREEKIRVRAQQIRERHGRTDDPEDHWLKAERKMKSEEEVVSVRIMSPRWLSFVGLLAIWPGPIQAHDIYSHLVDDKGGSCCDTTDCRPAPYRLRATGVEMFVFGTWVAVPADKIQYRALLGDAGETGGGHWCGAGYEAGVGVYYTTRCAVLPPQSAAAVGNAMP